MKNGQLLTVGNRICRIVRVKADEHACTHCPFFDNHPECNVQICKKFNIPYESRLKIIKTIS